MTTIEQSVKSQFAKVFRKADWRLFKAVADFNLAEAAYLKKETLNVPRDYKLLIRNVRKRLFIGIGVELLLKAAFLRLGFGINTAREGAGLQAPYKLSDVGADQLDPGRTFALGQLLTQLPQVLAPLSAMDGLKIAKVFRNKEGHTVTSSHKFDPNDYRKIEAALVEVYDVAFGEKLTVRISMETDEKFAWRVGH